MSTCLGKRDEIEKSNNFDEENDTECEENVNDDDDDDLPIDLLKNSSISKRSTEPRIPQQKRSHLGSATNIDHRSSALKSTKKRKCDGFQARNQLLDDICSSDEENEDQFPALLSGAALMKHINIQFNSIRQENVKQYTQLSKKIDRKHYIDAIDLSSYREAGSDRHFDNVVWFYQTLEEST